MSGRSVPEGVRSLVVGLPTVLSISWVCSSPQCRSFRSPTSGMGLGKTAAVLHYIDEVKPETVLIVTPKRVATTVWRQEAINWGLSDIAEKMVVVDGSPKLRHNILPALVS